MSRPSGRKVVRASLKVDLRADSRKIEALKGALGPETSAGKKCSMKIDSSSDDNWLSLTFTSKELVPLRASFNTNLRLASAALKTVDAVSNKIE